LVTVPPGNRLEALKGDRAGQFSIRIGDQYLICFVWTAAGPSDVEILDDHEEVMAMATRQAPVTPGELLLEEFLKPLGLSQDRLAKEVGVPSTWISEIVAGRRSITAETDSALRALQVTLSASEG